MNLLGKVPRFSPELRATAFYFTFYMSAAAGTVYAGIWLQQKGMSSEQIGIINALPVLVMLVLNLVVGRVADKASDWRQVIVIGALAAGVIPIGLFFVHDFWGILLFWTLAAIPIASISPVADAATMRMTRRNGADYGVIRAWGSVGYTAVIFITGYFVAWFGGGIFLPLFVGMALLRGLISLCLPNFRAPKNEQTLTVKPGAGRLLEVMKPWFLLPLVGWAMVFGTHLVLNAFSALLWKEQGISADIIGLLIAVGALAESAMMFVFGRFTRRFSARGLILFSAVVSAIRWAAMGFSPGVDILFGLQLLHSITFAMGFMGCVHFIANWTSEDIAAEAQSFFQVLQQAMSVIALVAFGWLVGLMGAKAYLVAAAFAGLGGLLVWLSLRMKQPKG
ncbi:MAG: MFS transporter [Devosia sp.]